MVEATLEDLNSLEEIDPKVELELYVSSSTFERLLYQAFDITVISIN